ncbi:MAG: hypothetical protein OR994_08655, partial [Candidatus Poseidoniales archaeon]|nr:hypothetical protein [Candidatus Poseidoniales archaeon]
MSSTKGRKTSVFQLKEFPSSQPENIDATDNKIKEYFDRSDSESWNIQLVDTGLDTMTGGRLKRIQDYVDDTFCVTYGD